MMKPRSNRVIAADQAPASSRSKTSEQLTNGVSQRNQPASSQQPTSAQTIRKRRSSINVYDQPSSLNSRLRQLETDMLRLDEDRTKLYDDTHSALAQYELKLGEIHAILKSRQDNVEKYVEDMRMLLQAKEEFEQQTKVLNEKNDRIHEKFMHRETTISREIKLLKNKFELLEKNRQFRSILQKSSTGSQQSVSLNASTSGGADSQLVDDLNSGLGDFGAAAAAAGAGAAKGDQADGAEAGGRSRANKHSARGAKNVRIKLSKMDAFSWLVRPLFRLRRSQASKSRQKRNRVASIAVGKTSGEDALATGEDLLAPVKQQGANSPDLQGAQPADGSLAVAADVNKQTDLSSAKDKTKRREKTSVIGRLFSRKNKP